MIQGLTCPFSLGMMTQMLRHIEKKASALWVYQAYVLSHEMMCLAWFLCFFTLFQVVNKGDVPRYEIDTGETTKYVSPDDVAKLILHKMKGTFYWMFVHNFFFYWSTYLTLAGYNVHILGRDGTVSLGFRCERRRHYSAVWVRRNAEECTQVQDFM